MVSVIKVIIAFVYFQKMNYFLTVLIATIFCLSKAYDIFDGSGQMLTPCFDTIHDEDCHTSIPNVYRSPYRRDELNNLDTKVFLFTSKNPDQAEPLHRCGGRLPDNSDFNPKEQTVILIHGWLDGVCRTAFMREAKLLLHERDNYNVILVDWTCGNLPDFARASSNSITVGDQLGFVIRNIMEQTKISGDNFHLIGHSSGTSVASFAAKHILKWDKNNKLRRITSLEPELAPFKNTPPNERLFHKDAKFVDVIHTHGGSCFPSSRSEPVGHADFYPNGGTNQTACYSYIYNSLLKGDLFYAIASLHPVFCSHLQSLQFFKVTIPKDSNYIGVQCNSYEEFKSGACKRCCKKDPTSCAVAGMDAEFHFPFKNKRREERKYYFDTSDQCPFEEDYEFNIYKDC